MSFTPLFTRMLAQNRLPHLILFQGVKGSGKSAMALSCVQQLLASADEFHPDLHKYYPEGRTGMHSLSAIQDFCREIYLSSYHGGYKCFIIYDAERMLPSNANALLKTFEEPPPKSIIFLLTSKPTLMLPTILSRCQKYIFHNERAIERDPLEEKLLNVLARKSSVLELVEIGEALEKERKQEEGEACKNISKDLNLLQRERAEQEIEGRYSMEYKKRAELLFETLLKFYHDLSLYHFKVAKDKLLFPEYIESYRELPMPNMDLWEGEMQKARIAYDRGVKLHYCLEALVL